MHARLLFALELSTRSRMVDLMPESLHARPRVMQRRHALIAATSKKERICERVERGDFTSIKLRQMIFSSRHIQSDYPTRLSKIFSKFSLVGLSTTSLI